MRITHYVEENIHPSIKKNMLEYIFRYFYTQFDVIITSTEDKHQLPTVSCFTITQ